MAGPSSFVPSPVSPSKPKQRFTLEQANRSLPLVSRIVRDIVTTHAEISNQQPATQKGKKKSSDDAAVKLTDAEMTAKLERLQMFVDELTSLGVELKDFDTGLIDFVGTHQGRDVYLCWRLSEPKIEYWHELEAGFAGRQPVSALEEKA